MTMLVPEYSPMDGGLWIVKRRRASMRAGEVSLKDLLNEFGVLKGLSGSAMGVESREVAV